MFLHALSRMRGLAGTLLTIVVLALFVEHQKIGPMSEQNSAHILPFPPNPLSGYSIS